MAFATDVINRVYLTHFLEAHDVDFKLDLS